VHDIALVQAMLRVVKDAKGGAYSGDYTGTYDAATKTAIIAFQTDQKLIAAPGATLDPAAAAKLDKTGLVGQNSATLKALSKALPATHKDMVIIEGTKTVYLPMAAASAASIAATIGAKIDLDPMFRANVATLVNQMFADHKIALSIPGDGWNRDFAAQAVVAKAGTGVGPGESNHQYGKAVDIGFQGLKWVAADGTIKADNFWLDAAAMPLDKRLAFWAARNKIAFAGLGLFKTNKPGDFIHVQAYSDTGVSYGRSLALLLQTVSPNGMKWKAVLGGKANQYKSDFGLGGALFQVGSALTIWGGAANVTKPDLVTALNAKLAVDTTFKVETFFGLPPAPVKPGAPPPPVLNDADIKPSYIATMKTRLQAEFKTANAKRDKWKPVP